MRHQKTTTKCWHFS